jgi:hypothetical protein
MRITYSECLSVALVIHHAVLYCRLWSLPGCTQFSTVSHKLHHFRKQLTEYKMCFDFLYNFCLNHISF